MKTKLVLPLALAMFVLSFVMALFQSYEGVWYWYSMALLPVPWACAYFALKWFLVSGNPVIAQNG